MENNDAQLTAIAATIALSALVAIPILLLALANGIPMPPGWAN